MNKILLIIKREYITRVRKKSFIIMCIIGPIIFAGILFIPAWLFSMEDRDEKIIAVIDNTNSFDSAFQNSSYTRYEFLKAKTVDEIRENFESLPYYALLYIPDNVLSTEDVTIYSNKQPNLNLIYGITNSIESFIKKIKIKRQNLPPDILDSINTKLSINTIKWSSDGEENESSTEIAMVIGYLGGLLIYMFIFLYGAQIMRGVIEEKISRIVEVIVSSVKPFQLMLGKILGVSLVGLTQFLAWIILTLIIFVSVQNLVLPDMQAIDLPIQTENITDVDLLSSETSENNTKITEFQKIFSSLQNVNFGLILGSFLFFFLGGYFLYGALFAAVGSAADIDTDVQQFMLPITIPLILSILVMISAIQNPEGPIAFWFSIIPLTSPIIMMVRIPFGIAYWELFLSMALLILAFLGTTWFAAKIYRTGILMYGKKVSYKELWKWLNYKN